MYQIKDSLPAFHKSFNKTVYKVTVFRIDNRNIFFCYHNYPKNEFLTNNFRWAKRWRGFVSAPHQGRRLSDRHPRARHLPQAQTEKSGGDSSHSALLHRFER